MFKHLVKDIAKDALGDAIEDALEDVADAAGDKLAHKLADKLEDLAEDAVEAAIERAEENREESKGERGGDLHSSGADPMKFNYLQPGKKATTILSPHLETITYGSMIIVLDNSQTSLAYNKPITGKIKVHLKT